MIADVSVPTVPALRTQAMLFVAYAKADFVVLLTGAPLTAAFQRLL
jgi:hypothetical protein